MIGFAPRSSGAARSRTGISTRSTGPACRSSSPPRSIPIDDTRATRRGPTRGSARTRRSADALAAPRLRRRAHRGSPPPARAGRHRGARRRAARAAREAAGTDARRVRPHPRRGARRRHRVHGRRERAVLARGAHRARPDRTTARSATSITARAATFFPALGDFYGGDRPWRFDRAAAGGGVVIDTGSHWLRPLARVARRGRRGGRRARPSASRHGGRVAVPRAAALRVGRRSRRSTRCSRPARSRTSRCSPSPGPTASCTVEGSGWVKLYDGTDWKGTKVGEQGGYLALVRSRAAPTSPAPCCTARRPRRTAEYALGELRLALAMYRSAETKQWEKV